MDRGAWWAAVHGVTKSRTQLSDFPFSFHSHALENPRDGGAWWAAIYGVAQSWTQLKRLSSSSSMTNDGQHFFRCFLATCLYSLEETVFKSFACFLFFLTLLSFILHVLLIQLPYHISNMQMLSPIL